MQGQVGCVFNVDPWGQICSGAIVGSFTVWKQAQSPSKQLEFLPVDVAVFQAMAFMNVKELPWPRCLTQASNLKHCLNSQTWIMLVCSDLDTNCVQSYRIYSATCSLLCPGLNCLSLTLLWCWLSEVWVTQDWMTRQCCDKRLIYLFFFLAKTLTHFCSSDNSTPKSWLIIRTSTCLCLP